MRLFWWRAKKDKAGEARAASAGAPGTVQVAESPAPELREGLLLFARDYLLARQARVRVEHDDLLTGVLPDGTEVRYTTSLARANEHADAQLLAPGGGELNALLEDVAREAQVVALSLPERASATELAREALTEPSRECGRCGAAGIEGAIAPCETCPLREGRYAFAGFGAVRRARDLREREARSVEVVFRIAARDKAGRLDDTVRVAFDLETWSQVPLLSDEAIAAATGEAALTWMSERLHRALEAAQARLRPGVSATAAFLGMRSRTEFLRRRDEIASTAASLRREPGSDIAAVERSLAVELQHLDDVFAVEVDVSVASVAFVRSRLVDVALESADGRELAATVDVGRGHVRPPACAACGEPCRSGAICREGHIVCGTCQVAATEAGRCSVCASGVPTAATARPPYADSAAGGSGDGEHLSGAALDALPEAVWSACVVWLLEQRGVAVERATTGQAGLTIHGAMGERPVFASAVRFDTGWSIGAGDVRRAAAPAAGQPDALCVLLTPTATSPEARAEAGRLGVELWDGAALEARAAGAASRYECERVAELDDRARRLALASSVRAELVAAMEAAEAALSTGGSGPTLSGQKRIVEAARATGEARGVLLQAFAAWETTAADYREAFGERAERDGSLALVAAADALQSLLGRIRHLAAVTRDAARGIAASASKGELGYSAWRKAVLEELVARCESVRWRALAVDPSKADDFAAARDEQANLKAQEATVAAARAAMRAEAAYGQLGARARL